MKYTPYDYQRFAEEWILEKPYCGLFLDMGLGKTVITLTAILRLIYDGDVYKVLVVAPQKVAESTWSNEVHKWDHLTGLRVSVVKGTPVQRKRLLDADADIYVLSRDLFVWLCAIYDGRLPFDMVVLDELTSFKRRKSQRFKMLRKVRPSVSRLVGLTGTPAANGLKDLWAQLYAIDLGARLERTEGAYHAKYFNCVVRNYIMIKCTPKEGAEKEIHSLISDVCVSMSAKDYLQLPAILYHDVEVRLSDTEMEEYQRFEREQILEFPGSEKADSIVASSAAALSNKLSQFANGAVYDAEKAYKVVSDAKLEALIEIVEGANGASVLVFYQFQHDEARITAALKGYRVHKYHGAAELEAWNRGEIDVLLTHPASTAFGLNMQEGGHIVVWFGLGWNLELYQQANARLYRNGQTQPVQVFHLIASGTIDIDQAASINSKADGQEALMRAIKARLQRYEQKQNL